MMKLATLSGIAIACALMMAAPAAAVEYFFDDFSDGEMISDWTDLERQVRVKDITRYGIYGDGSMGQDDTSDTKGARSWKPLSDTTMGDTVYFSFNFIHTGSHMDFGSLGTKTTRAYVVNDDGKGYGIFLQAIKRDTGTGQLGIIATEDFGATELGGMGPGAEITLPYMAEDDFTKHMVGFEWVRGSSYMNVYLDNIWINTVTLDLVQNEEFKDPTRVITNPWNLLRTDLPPADNWSWAGPVITDDIWFGDEQNPHSADPTLTPGDTNGDLVVDIQDLTALAANWSALEDPVTSKNWNQADFNYDWMVDIQDLTGLAANWTFPPGSTEDSSVPEPTTMALFALGGLGLLRKKR